MIEGLVKMMNSNESGPKNLGNPNEISILELSKLIKKITKSKSKIKYLALPKDDPTKRQPDISKARKLLGWNPKVKLDIGLKRTIKWFKKNGF
jgi:nucleoside-diphosphate-sugar epimerase